MQGTYFFADFITNRVFSFRYTGAGITELMDRTAELLSPSGISGSISSFGEDGFGNLNLVGLGGRVGQIGGSIPEPGGWAMMLVGLALVGRIAIRRRA